MGINYHRLKYYIGLIVFVCSGIVQPAKAQEHKTFSNLNEVLTFAKEKNYIFINDAIQSRLADLTRKTAFGNVINPTIPASFQLIDNTKQQVIFLPGEVFGQPGTFRSVTTGQKYSSLINLQPQFGILNLAAIAQIRSAKINQQLTENQNKINEKNIYDQVITIYFNILSYKGEIEIVKQNLATADTILKVTQNRFNENVGRKQEVNEAEVNVISLQNNLEQLVLNLKIQEESLALFFENSIYPDLRETVWAYENTNASMQTNNTLQLQNDKLQLQMILQDIKVAKAQNWPTLSFISSFNWQSLGNDFFYKGNANSINYNYVGLKLSMDLPTTVSKFSNIKNKQYQSEILKTTAEHSVKESETRNRQLILDYEKALSQLQNFKKIALLKEDTYNKIYNQYQENILSLDDLLISYNNMLAAKLNVVTALANIGFNKSKIDINNKF
jgi:outer membrane protein TolC